MTPGNTRLSRRFSILQSTPSNVVVEAVSYPLLAAGSVTSLVMDVVHGIHPNGSILITSKVTTSVAQPLEEWRCAVIGVCDLTQEGVSGKADTKGWIRASATQDPYDWSSKVDPYLFAYWSKTMSAPYAHWTQASIMLVRDPSNPHITHQSRHEWTNFKRWYFADDRPASRREKRLPSATCCNWGQSVVAFFPTCLIMPWRIVWRRPIGISPRLRDGGGRAFPDSRGPHDHQEGLVGR